MQTVQSRPLPVGRPTWISAADWLLIQERAREIRQERERARLASVRAFAVPLPPQDDLDFAWEKDNPSFMPTAEFSRGGPSPKADPPPQRKQGMDRQAECPCGHKFRTYALNPCCARCNGRSVKCGPWETRPTKGKRPATCTRCTYEWLTASTAKPACPKCGTKRLKLGPWSTQ